MARERRFDVSEMAIATVLQAIAYGVEIALLPVVMASRFQESALFVRADSPLSGPGELKGKRVGVRAYSQTTGLWLRGILQGELRRRARPTSPGRRSRARMSPPMSIRRSSSAPRPARSC